MPKKASRYSQNAYAVVATSAFNGRGEQLIGTAWRDSPGLRRNRRSGRLDSVGRGGLVSARQVVMGGAP